MPVTKSKTVEMEEMLKQLLEMMRDLRNSQEEFLNRLEAMGNSQETTKDSQETMKTEPRTEVKEKVEAIEKVDIVEETATSPKNEVKKKIKRIKSEAEEKREELKLGNEGTDSAKANGTTDSNEDASTDNVEQKPKSNDNAKEGESSGSVAAESSYGVPEGEKEQTTNLQVAWEDLQFAKRIYQKRGDEDEKGLAGAIVSFGEVSLEGGNFESAVSDIKEGLRKQDEIAASTVEEQQGQDETRQLQRPQEGPYSIVTELNYDGWRIPKRPRVKMRFVRLKLFEGSTDGVT